MSNKEKVYCNVKGISRIQRPDGMPSATVTITNLMVNNELSINPTKSGTIAMSFPSNLALDDFTKSRLSHALNGMTLNETQYGVSVKVVSFVKPGGRYDQLASSLEKGAKVTLVQGTLTPKQYVNDNKEIINYLELMVDPFNFGYIVSQTEAKARKEQYQQGSAAAQPHQQAPMVDVALNEGDLPF